MSFITKITAETIADSRGRATIKVTARTKDNFASCAVPSGASTGKLEALELRDSDGQMNQAQDSVNQINELLLGVEVTAQEKIDQMMIDADGTTNKARLGGNAILGVSIACAKLAALETGKTFKDYLKEKYNQGQTETNPKLFMNLINAGAHGPYGSPFQEYQIIPETNDPNEAYELGLGIFSELKEIVTKHQDQEPKTGDEGGFIIKDTSLRLPLDFLTDAINKKKSDTDVSIGLDIAANSFFSAGAYRLGTEALNATALTEIHLDLIDTYNIKYIEDPFQEEDFDSFKNLNQKVKSQVLIIGDDLTVTNPAKLKEAIEKDSLSALIIKPNQIGTLSETAETINLAQTHNIKNIASHRSGETLDDFIADIALAFNCFGLKAGAPGAPFRDEKYSRLITLLR